MSGVAGLGKDAGVKQERERAVSAAVPEWSLFPVTHWTVVLSARDSGKAALEQLCKAYAQPVRVFLRGMGYSHEDAEDLAQEFLNHLILPEVLRRVDQGKGRFRSFVAACLERHVQQHEVRVGALKRGGGAVHLPIEGASGSAGVQAVSGDLLPHERFELEWGRTLLNRALGRLEAEAGTPARRRLVKEVLPALQDPDDAGSWVDMARRLGMNEGALRTAVHRIRRRLAGLIREEVAVTVSAAEEVEAELVALKAILSRAGSRG